MFLHILVKSKVDKNSRAYSLSITNIVCSCSTIMLSLIKKKISWLILQYELITCLNMFEPWEKVCLNTTILLIVSLVSYSSYVYLPHYLVSLVSSMWSFISSGEERIDHRYESSHG